MRINSTSGVADSEQQDTRDRALMSSDLTAVCQPRDAV